MYRGTISNGGKSMIWETPLAILFVFILLKIVEEKA